MKSEWHSSGKSLTSAQVERVGFCSTSPKAAATGHINFYFQAISLKKASQTKRELERDRADTFADVCPAKHKGRAN